MLPQAVRQQDEFEALRAIYAEDEFRDCTSGKTAWKNQQPLKECRITVHALEDDLKDRVSLVLHFKLPAHYPSVPPTITLEDPVGLSSEAVKELHKQLQATARSLLPNEAIFELASEAASYITGHHAIIQSHAPSLIDQLGARAAIEEEAHAARLSAREEEERQALLKERQELLQQFEADKLRQKERHQSSRKDASAAPTSSERLLIPSKTFKNVQLAGRTQTVSVILGSGLPNAPIGRLCNAEIIDENTAKHPAQVLSLDLSSIKAYLASSQGSKRLSTLTEHLDKLQSLSSKHLAVIYGHSYDSAAGTLDILLEPLAGNLGDLLDFVQRFPAHRIQALGIQIAEAIGELHALGLLHKSLALDKIHLQPGDHSSVKLSGACYIQLLVDMNRSTHFTEVRQQSVVPDEWKCPEVALEPLEYSKQRDVWEFGLLLVAMHGFDVFASYSKPSLFLESLDEGPLRDALSQIFVPLKSRATIDSIHSLLASPSSGSSTLPLKSPDIHPSNGLSASMPVKPAVVLTSKGQSAPFWQPSYAAMPMSRYRAEFEEVEFLGKGGFGKVVKSLNKLDRNFYAIKKVKLSNHPATEHKILREVTTWSRLSHPSIVRYHTAWVESETESVSGDVARQNLESSQSLSQLKTSSEEEESDASAINEEIDLNVDLEDTDFLSVNPHLSASSYPHIHFGNESDDSSLPSRNPSRQSLFNPSPTDSPPPFEFKQQQQQRTLYIQMEFISGRTLRETIDDGLSHEEAWRILSQILHAMAYFTSMSITHRDLKPQNCFIDSEGHVKVGDFGLAVETKAALDEQLHRGPKAATDYSDLTSGVGTSLYIPPEMISQRRNPDDPVRRDRAYVSRIDMYSLGIVFFEMVHPMKTKMERIMAIKNLRSPSILFPADFHGTPGQRQLIRSLLVHDPQDRPSPQELLQSGTLPAPLIDETVAEVSRLISSSKSPHRSTILKSLFLVSKKESQINDLLFDHGSSTQVDISAQVAKSRLLNLFEKRGAIELSVEGPLPFTSLYEINEGRRPVKFLDQDGTVVMLPYDHTVPLCRRVARDSGLSRLKRYTIGPVYRQRDIGAGQPRAPVVASFDIVTTQFTFAAEAECLQLADAILDEFGLSEAYLHTLGHSGILQYALQEVPAEHRNSVLRFLEVSSSRAAQLDPRKALSEFSRLPGVSGKTVQLFSSLYETYDASNVEDQQALEALVKAHPKLRKHVGELQMIASLAKAMGCKRRLAIAPLLAVNVHLHHAKPTCFFQTSLPGKGVQTIAVGGRYDGLVEAFLPPDRSSAPNVVGVSLALAQLAHAVDQEPDLSKTVAVPQAPSTRRCDVYVVSFTSGLEEARLSLVSELWQHGIRADLMYEGDISTPEQMTARRRLENLLYLIIVKPTQPGREQTYKVRDLIRSGEDEVAKGDLVEYLQDHVQEQTRMEVGHPREVGSGEARRGPAPQVGEVHFLTLQDEKKKQFIRLKNRNFQADKAATAVQKQLAQLSDEVPIFVVDLEGSAIDTMRSAPKWYSQDSEVFRKLVDSVPAAKRGTVHSLRDAIRQQAQQGQPFVFLYFSRIDKSWLLALD